MTASVQLHTPLTRASLEDLRSGTWVMISGVIYGARDAAHQRMVERAARGEPLPFDPMGQVVYYVGPTPAPPGRVIGAAGPTTASRMDPFTPFLLERGLMGMIGKGRRSDEVRAAMMRYGAVYFGSIEGTAALLSSRIRESRVVAYGDLGAEAVFEFVVEDFPAIVVHDTVGGDLYSEGRARYRSG